MSFNYQGVYSPYLVKKGHCHYFLLLLVCLIFMPFLGDQRVVMLMNGVFILYNVCSAPYLFVAFFGWLRGTADCLQHMLHSSSFPTTGRLCCWRETCVVANLLYGDSPLVFLVNDSPTNFQLNLLFINPSETEVSSGNSTRQTLQMKKEEECLEWVYWISMSRFWWKRGCRGDFHEDTRSCIHVGQSQFGLAPGQTCQWTQAAITYLRKGKKCYTADGKKKKKR